MTLEQGYPLARWKLAEIVWDALRFHFCLFRQPLSSLPLCAQQKASYFPTCSATTLPFGDSLTVRPGGWGGDWPPGRESVLDWTTQFPLISPLNKALTFGLLWSSLYYPTVAIIQLLFSQNLLLLIFNWVPHPPRRSFSQVMSDHPGLPQQEIC